MPVDVPMLEPLDFFKDLNLGELNEFASLLNPRTVKAGEAIIQKGTPALTLYFIISGKYELSFEDGRSITLDKKGEVMGWSSVVAPFHYTGTVKALTGGDVLYISGRDFFQLIQANNVLGEKVMKKINTIVEQRKVFFSGSE